jgi:DNA-binding response OmpR family regulator
MPAIAVDDAVIAFPGRRHTESTALPMPGWSARANGRPMRILLVDDGASGQDMLVRYLEEHDTRVFPISTRQSVPHHIAVDGPDLILLALRFGQQDGIDLLREIRLRSDIPVIIADDHGSHEIDRVLGLELGADDYLSKPFGARELLARIRAILRRWETAATSPHADADSGRYRFGGWQLDRRSRRLSDPVGRPVSLTKGEYSLLLAFLDAPQRCLTREHLLRATHVHEDRFDRSIDVQILRLRRRIETDPAAPRIIRTERGIGYFFDLPVAREGAVKPARTPVRWKEPSDVF